MARSSLDQCLPKHTAAICNCNTGTRERGGEIGAGASMERRLHIPSLEGFELAKLTERHDCQASRA